VQQVTNQQSPLSHLFSIPFIAPPPKCKDVSSSLMKWSKIVLHK